MNAIAAEKLTPAFASPSAAAMVERSRAMIPAVRARAAETEKLRRLPNETVREYEAAGLCKIWIPRRYGGYEHDLVTGLETMWEVARGCASSSWCLTVWQQHSWIVAHYAEKAQEETLGAEPDFHIGGVLAARGKAVRVDGGYRISGTWPFGSGCDHGTWILLGAAVVDADGKPVPIDREVYGVPIANSRLCLLPIGDVTINNDWETAGLAGTGSHSVTVKDVFVPEHRTLFVPDALDGRAPGHGLHRSRLFHAAYYAFLNCALGGPAPGVAQGAFDAFMENIDRRNVMPMNMIQANMIRTHRQVAEIDAKIQLAKLLQRNIADRISEAAETGRALSVEERAKCRRDTALSVHIAYEATEQIFLASGGSSLSLKNPIQRFMRDMHGIKSHYFMDLETGMELAGGVMLGHKPFTYLF